MNLKQLFSLEDQRVRPVLSAARLAAFLLAAFPLLVSGKAQVKRTSSANTAAAAVQHVKLLLDKGTPALEIVTTAPVDPQISKMDDGMRLIIDLPNTNMSVREKIVPIKSRDLSAMRLNLLNSAPPVVHVEIDFKRPLGYTWDSAGNRLVISFHEIVKKEGSQPSAAAARASPLPVSAPAAPADFANVMPAERLASGASVTADSETTVLRVKRVGDVYVCPRTTISVVHSRSGPDLMLGLNGGALETHLALQNSADEVVTPDFRILLRGPGQFHYAIRTDSLGNTCIRTLAGNTSSAIIYELMGDGKFEVQPTDQFVFHNGKLSPEDTALHSESTDSTRSILPVDCGCPPPALAPQTLLASNVPQRQILPTEASSGPMTSRQSNSDPEPSPDPAATLARDQVSSNSPPPPDSGLQMADLSQSQREQPHASVEASLTFTPNPAVMAARRLPASGRLVSWPIAVTPPSPRAQEHRNVFGKIKTFFSRVFH